MDDPGAGRRAACFAILAVLAGCSASQPGDPTGTLQALPAAVRNACNLIESVARETRGVKVERTIGPVPDESTGIARDGCGIKVTGSFAALQGGEVVFEHWRKGLTDRGWQEQPEYTADGPDGTAFAFASRGVICLFQGRWDGGDDAEPDAPRDDSYRGSASCAASGPDTISPSRR